MNVKRFLPLLLVVGAFAVPAFATPGSAQAAAPCRDRIFNDWFADGRIASTYPILCYRDALKHIPTDAQVYSSLSGDIKAAMNAALERARGVKNVPGQVGHGFNASVLGSVKGASVSRGPSSPDHGKLASRQLLSASNASTGAPLPILVLGGLALALAAAGAIGVGVRHARGRRR